MVTIKFLDPQTENEALGFLMSRFSGSAFRSGEVIVPPEALTALAVENYRFTVLGRATHDQMATFRSHVYLSGSTTAESFRGDGWVKP